MEGVVSKKAGFVSSYIHSLGLARFLLSCLPSPLHRRRRLREMANLPPSLSIGAASFAAPSPPPPSPGASSSSSAAAAAPGAAKDRKMASAEQLVLDLCDPELRENALLDLSKVSPCREKLCVFSPLPQFSFFFILFSLDRSLWAPARGILWLDSGGNLYVPCGAYESCSLCDVMLCLGKSRLGLDDLMLVVCSERRSAHMLLIQG